MMSQHVKHCCNILSCVYELTHSYSRICDAFINQKVFKNTNIPFHVGIWSRMLLLNHIYPKLVHNSSFTLYFTKLYIVLQSILADPKAKHRVLLSYLMMLDFYGMRLNTETGEISRAANWKKRFEHLNRFVLLLHRQITRL